MRHRVRVALYNRLFAQSIVALCSGVGDKIPPWGKGLIFGNSIYMKIMLHLLQGLPSWPGSWARSTLTGQRNGSSKVYLEPIQEHGQTITTVYRLEDRNDQEPAQV